MITKTNESLSNIFDVEPSTGEVIEQIVPDIACNDSTVKIKSEDADLEICRTTMHNLLLQGQRSLENAIIIANGTEDADSFNAVSTLIGKMTDASTKLMGLHEIKAKINRPVVMPQPVAQLQPTAGSTNISGPVVFVGSTSEFAKNITDIRKLQSNQEK